MFFKCPYCDYQSLRSDSILNHLQSVHSNEISEEEINSLIGRKNVQTVESMFMKDT